MKAATAGGDVDLGDTVAVSHMDEQHSQSTTTVITGPGDVPAGPVDVPPQASQPMRLAPMHVNN